MKIGIVTFPRAINYGTSLQAAALRAVLLRNSNDVIFCEHDCEQIDSSNALFDIKRFPDIKYTIAHLYNLPDAIRRKRAFEAFWEKYFAFSKNPLDSYDAVVSGSDQVWNYNLTGNDSFYFLNFDKKNVKKVAYAASFGLSSVDADQYDILRPLLEDFDYMSVRENTAAEIVKDICARDLAEVVLDPTLLLRKEQWKEMADPSLDRGGYIFVYTVFNSDTLWDFAEDLSKKTGLPIKTISYSRFHKRNAEYSYTAGPAQWLGFMLNADYVVTNSFHGMAFSVNFQKRFFFELPPKSSGVGSRLADMARKYGLEDRELKRAKMETPIDWESVNKKLDEDREVSLEFIRKFTQQI